MKYTACILFFVMAASAVAQQTPENMTDKTLSPYFLVTGDDFSVDHLPLKSTTAQVNIAGVIADVKVTQEYKNEGSKTLEAVYVFPASTRASVYGMKMTIGKRIITAKVRTRETARREYEQARQEGKSASLLEQQRPNVFQMNIANILPGDVIKVEMNYTELLVPTDGIYEFVYPTVVGPRYSELTESTAPKSEEWVSNPYLHEGVPPTYIFDIAVNLSGSMRIQEATCTSHKVNISFDSPSYATIRLAPGETSGGNRDFILKYRLAGGNIESGLLLYRGEKENFFLLMLQPPERTVAALIPPREYVFIVDVSGSMRGFPLEISKKLLRNLIGNLRPADKFNVMLFAGASKVLSEQSLPANAGNIDRAIRFLEDQRGGGGTQLLPALNRALGMKGTEAYSRSFVIATDGYVRVEKEAFDLIRNSLGNANMFTFGIGSSVNRHLLEGMARVGMGEPFIITKKEEAHKKAMKFRQYIQTPVLTRARADFGNFDVYDVEPPGIPDVLAKRPVILFGKWRGRPKGEIRLTGITGDRRYVKTLDVSQFSPHDVNAALPFLWARHKIALLSDYGSIRPGDNQIKEEITQLGLAYNLLTAYTSFVAIDSEVRAKDGKTTTVRQPLPLPQGVSDAAVGGVTRSSSMRMKGMPGVFFAREAAPPTPLAKPKRSPLAVYKKKEKSKKDVSMTEDGDKTAMKGHVSLIPEKTVISNNLSRSLQDMIQKRLKQIERCYQAALKKIPGIRGEAALRIAIDSAGRVTDVRLISGELTYDVLKKCIISVVKQWQFPAPADGKAAYAEYSLVFELK